MTTPEAGSLGHYTLHSQLGAGGMGEVYLGTDTRLSRKVAIKVLLPAAQGNEEAQRRMLREARLVATIDHPNVCTIYDIGEADGRPFIVMQYIEGETLLQRMARTPLTAPETADLARQVAAALAVAHGHGIVHRDIKPANIMIGSGGLVKVLDFGLAKSFRTTGNEAETEVLVSTPGLVAGTAPYMSPEQVRGLPLDGRTDIFSLGTMLYEIAMGKRPFDRPTAVATITAILFDDPPPMSDPAFAALTPVIRRCLAKSRDDRYPSAAALQEALATPSAPHVITGRRAQVKSDPETEKLVLRGRIQWNKRHPDALRQSIALFQEAIERDPGYASAYAGLADTFLMLGFLQALPPREVIPKAKAAVLRAIELDPAMAEPHASLGYLSGVFDWDFAVAERELEQAMELDPSYPWAPHWYGIILTGLGATDKAMEQVTRARDLDPLSPIINTALGIPLHLGRRYAEALQVYARVLEVESTFAPVHYYIGMTHEQMGNYDEAIPHLQRAGEIAAGGALFPGALGHCLAISGRRDAARQILTELEQRSTTRYVSPFNLMIIHLGLGDVDQTLIWLERALEERTAALWTVGVEPRFDPIRGNARFREVVGRYGLGAGG